MALPEDMPRAPSLVLTRIQTEQSALGVVEAPLPAPSHPEPASSHLILH